MAESKKSVGESSKVMDVSKPGKGKIIATSRPIVAPVVDKPTTDTDAPLDAKTPAPSASHRVIQPIHHDAEPEEISIEKSVEAVLEAAEKKSEESKAPEPEPETEAEKQIADDLPIVKEEPEVPKPAPEPEPEKEEPKPAEEPKPTEVAKEEPKEKPAPVAAESSDAATVDELAKSVETKKEVAKKAEESAKKDAEVQALIDSKKYVVPVNVAYKRKGAKKSGSPTGLIIFLLLVILIAGAYLLVDAGIIDVGFDVPYELIK